MDFLKLIYLGNTVESYLIVLATILVVLLLRKFLSRYLASALYYFVQKTWSTIDKKKFKALVVRPLGWFIAVCVSVFAIDKLNYPEELRFNIYHHPVEGIVQKIGIVLIIITFIRLILRLIDFIALILHEKKHLENQKADDQLVTFFRDFLKVLINICGLFLIIKAAFNQDIGTLLTGLSIVGAALALAAKESLENLIASFIIFFDKPFFTGDTVKVNAVTGTVERIGLRSTRIRTPEKTLVTVPNKQMVDSVVDNMSLRTQRRSEMKLEMAEKTDLENAQKFIAAVKEIIESKKDLIQNYTLFINDYSKGSITATLEYFTGHIPMADFNTLKQDINIQLIKLRTEMNIEFPVSAPSINIINSENEATPKNNNSII
ncbi:MAG: mechanosensitive ion channel domain-containing protein [Ferruginibacter sp.]